MTKEIETTLQKVVQVIHTKASREIEKSGNLPPTLFTLFEDKVEAHDLSLFINDKNLMVTVVQAYKNQKGVNGTVFVSEAWTLILEGELPKDKNIPLPSESPDRKEALVYLAETAKAKVFAQADIIRKGDKLSIGPLDFSKNAGELSGRFVGGISHER